jgi:hypothetical protein
MMMKDTTAFAFRDGALKIQLRNMILTLFKEAMSEKDGEINEEAWNSFDEKVWNRLNATFDGIDKLVKEDLRRLLGDDDSALNSLQSAYPLRNTPPRPSEEKQPGNG